MFSRTKCCICGDVDLTLRLKTPRVPVTYSPPPINSLPVDDETVDLEWGGCCKCGSLQLMTLGDPSIIYNSAHHGTSASPLWKEHHQQFAEFVRDRIPPAAQVIEIGGAGGNLASLLRASVSTYTILDLEKHEDLLLDGVHFEQGNCETYKFLGTHTLILSHVFEHLYIPLDFLMNVRKCGVKYIFLANPVMQVGSEVLPIDIEHTYFADDLDVEDMFMRHGYVLQQKIFFRKHAFFMCYKLSESVSANRHLRPGRDALLVSAFNKRKDQLTEIDLTEPSYIVPAGQFGQLIYYYTKSINIIAYLDNDVNKQGRRVYGTPYFAQPFETIRHVNCPRVVIYVRHYAPEMVSQLRSINPGVRIVIV